MSKIDKFLVNKYINAVKDNIKDFTWEKRDLENELSNAIFINDLRRLGDAIYFCVQANPNIEEEKIHKIIELLGFEFY